MEYAELTVGLAWMATGALVTYAALVNRNPIPAKFGAAMRVPVTMAGAGVWLVRTGVRLSLRGSKRAGASR